MLAIDQQVPWFMQFGLVRMDAISPGAGGTRSRATAVSRKRKLKEWPVLLSISILTEEA